MENLSEKRFITIEASGKLERWDSRPLASKHAEQVNRPDNAVAVFELKEFHCTPALVTYP
jgi:hypothetical protein